MCGRAQDVIPGDAFIPGSSKELRFPDCVGNSSKEGVRIF